MILKPIDLSLCSESKTTLKNSFRITVMRVLGTRPKKIKKHIYVQMYLR